MRKHSLTIRELKTRIEEIENLDLKSVSIDYIKDLINAIFTGHTMMSGGRHVGLLLYRGIKYESRPDNVSFLSYPPKDKAKVNRASREGEQIFYSSGMREIPFFELGCKEGDRLVISKWVTTKKLLFNNIGFTDEVFENLNASREVPTFGRPDQTDPAIYLEENILVKNTLAKMFSQKVPIGNEDLYKLTIAIAEMYYLKDVIWEKVIYERQQIDALMYPTIAMNASSDNFAIKRSFVDEGGLKLQNVEYLEINENGTEVINSLNHDYRTITLAEADTFLENGSIVWQDRVQHWTKDKNFEDLTFNFEGDKWVARDDNGNIVEPDLD